MATKPSSKSFLVSDESINGYNCRLISNGGDASEFLNNPVMLYMHQRGNVIGLWENLRLTDKQWMADAVFDMDDTRPEGGAEIGGKVNRGFLRAVSVGAQVANEDDAIVYNDTLKCYDIMKWKFREISIVDIGSNANTLRLYNRDGEPINELNLSAMLDQFKPTKQSIFNTSKPMELKAIALAMGLPETATEQEVLALASQNKTAASELVTLKTAEVNRRNGEAVTLVDEAISDKRIPAASKDAYLKLFASDHESAKIALAAIPKPAGLITLATHGQAALSAAAIINLSKEEKAKKFDELDKNGGLLALAQSDRDSFNLLFEAKFGVKPDKVSV